MNPGKPKPAQRQLGRYSRDCRIEDSGARFYPGYSLGRENPAHGNESSPEPGSLGGRESVELYSASTARGVDQSVIPGINGDMLSTLAAIEKEKIARCQVAWVRGDADACLLSRCARKLNSMLGVDELNEAGAVERPGRRAAERVSYAELLPRACDHMWASHDTLYANGRGVRAWLLRRRPATKGGG